MKARGRGDRGPAKAKGFGHGKALGACGLRGAPSTRSQARSRTRAPSAAALAPDTHLDVTLWLLGADLRWPMDEGSVVVWAVYDADQDGLSPEGNKAALDAALSAAETSSFVLEYHAALTEARMYSDNGSAVYPRDCAWDKRGHLVTCADAWGRTLSCEDGPYSCALLAPVTLRSDVKALVRPLPRHRLRRGAPHRRRPSAPNPEAAVKRPEQA